MIDEGVNDREIHVALRMANHELLRAYADLHGRLDLPEDLVSRMSSPLLLSIQKSWLSRSTRVLVIGQETFGWGCFAAHLYPNDRVPNMGSFREFQAAVDGVDQLQNGYSAFSYAKHQPNNYRSPFWRAYRELRSHIGDEPDGLDTGVMWTNLFRSSLAAPTPSGDRGGHGSVLRNSKPEEVDVLINLSCRVLHREIEILRPTAVIFFTGPNYDQFLDQFFKGVERTPVTEYSERQCSRLIHDSLPHHTFRTYHPNYLSRSRQWNLLDRIAAEILVD